MNAQAASTGSCTIVNHRSDQAKSTQSKRFRCKASHGLVAFKPESPPKRHQNLIKAQPPFCQGCWSSSGIMSRFEYLPDEVLKLVMQHVPVKDRLTSCCLVNSRLHAAAVAATQELQLYFGDIAHPLGRIPHQHEDCVLNWLSSYGQHLTSLDMGSLSQPLQQLPCPDLLELKLSNCNVQLGPAADGQSGVLPGCTKLTKLDLYCKFADNPGGVLGGLSSLEHLQHLHLWPNGSSWPCTPSSAALPCLKHLTYLDTYCSWMSDENICQLSTLTNLQEAHLDFAIVDFPVGLVMFDDLSFPASLTKLVLCSMVEPDMLLAAPAALKHLELLSLVDGPAEGADSVLDCLPQLHHLTALCIEPVGGLEWPPAGPAYSALTASSSLAALVLRSTNIPGCAWPHVFPTAHQLLCLTSLLVDEEQEWGASSEVSAWGAAGVSSLIACCPNLCEVEFTLQHGLHISELHKLTALTSMEVRFSSGIASAFQQSLKGLAAVTQLQELSAYLDNPDLQVSSLLPLTSLTALTNLGCYNGGLWRVYLRSACPQVSQQAQHG
jgi:hypothetical protein